MFRVHNMWTNYIGVTTRSCAIVPHCGAGRKQFDDFGRGGGIGAGQGSQRPSACPFPRASASALAPVTAWALAP
jgi:hypothetical protein